MNSEKLFPILKSIYNIEVLNYFHWFEGKNLNYSKERTDVLYTSDMQYFMLILFFNYKLYASTACSLRWNHYNISIHAFDIMFKCFYSYMLFCLLKPSILTDSII